MHSYFTKIHQFAILKMSNGVLVEYGYFHSGLKLQKYAISGSRMLASKAKINFSKKKFDIFSYYEGVVGGVVALYFPFLAPCAQGIKSNIEK